MIILQFLILTHNDPVSLNPYNFTTVCWDLFFDSHHTKLSDFFRCRRPNTIVCNFYRQKQKVALATFLCLKGQKLESKISRKFGDYWHLSEFFTSFSASSSLSSVVIFFGLLWWLRLWRLYPLLFPDHFHALQWICTVFWIIILICINVAEAYILFWPFYTLQRLLLLRSHNNCTNCCLFHRCGMLPNV